MPIHNTSVHNNKEHNQRENRDENQDLAFAVLEKIHQNKIHPTTRKYFVAREIFLWIPGVFVTTLGGFALGGIMFNSIHSSLPYQEFIDSKPTSLLMKELPAVWIITFLLFALLIIKAFRQTKSGYKYSTSVILGVSVMTSFLIGIVLIQADERYENRLLRFPTEHIQRSLWFNPEDGRLTGLLSKTADDHFILTDINEKVWDLNTTEVPNISDPLFLHGPVRIIGKAEDEDTFLVCVMLPGNIEKRNGVPSFLLKNTPVPTFIECDPILKELRAHHHERKNNPHP